MMDQKSPMTQARRVFTGIDGSSVFATAERTSRYCESSSKMQSLKMYTETRRIKLLTNSVKTFVHAIVKVWVGGRECVMLYRRRTMTG